MALFWEGWLVGVLVTSFFMWLFGVFSDTTTQEKEEPTPTTASELSVDEPEPPKAPPIPADEL